MIPCEIEYEVDKINSVCDGLDNVENINKHYEKMIKDLINKKSL